MNIKQIVKTFIESFSDDKQTHCNDDKPSHNEADADLTKYETRRSEIENSLEPINGIFYINGNEIIPDYFSEHLASDKDSPNGKERYHFHFYYKYMQWKYPGLLYNEKYIPRGRIDVKEDGVALYIDKCHFRDIDLIDRLRKLYRITGKTTVFGGGNYTCHICKDSDQDDNSDVYYITDDTE